jgi:hypothetical protein
MSEGAAAILWFALVLAAVSFSLGWALPRLSTLRESSLFASRNSPRQREVMYQDLLKDTAAELERLNAATQAVGDRREKETVSVLLVLFHVMRELDKRQDDLVRRITELERLAADHGEELRNLRRRLERRT